MGGWLGGGIGCGRLGMVARIRDGKSGNLNVGLRRYLLRGEKLSTIVNFPSSCFGYQFKVKLL